MEITMAFMSVHVALAVFMVFSFPPFLSSSEAAAFADPPLSSVPSLQEVSPDIAPLLPSHGGFPPSPIGSDTTTITSTISPPSPDDTFAPGSLFTFSPFGLLQASSVAPRSMASSSGMAVFAGLAIFWSG